MSLLKFLKTSTVEEVTVTAGKGGIPKKQRNPNPAIVAIRLWKDGSVYPSKAAVDKFGLEYKASKITKTAIAVPDGEEPRFKRTYEFPDGTGNGLDFIDTRLWEQLKGQEGAMLLCAVVPKSAPKVDLFNTVGYDDDGIPTATVLEQGASTFGEQIMLRAVEDVYGVIFNRPALEADPDNDLVAMPAIEDGVDWVDLAIFDKYTEGDETIDVSAQFTKKILFVPKRITRGKEKGKPDYERRDNVIVYGLAPAEMVLPGYKKDEVKQEDAQEGKIDSGTIAASADNTVSNGQPKKTKKEPVAN